MSSRDKGIVGQLDKRFLRGENVDRSREVYKGKALKSKEFYNNVALLVDNSKHFIPCYARVVLGPPEPVHKAKPATGSPASPEPVGVVKAKSKNSAAPKIFLQKFALRGTN
jgi:hypothetical protein